MAPKIFLTGVTGYVGGDAFYALEKKHPDYEYTLLVRNEERGKEVKVKYPNAKLVYGSLDDSIVIEKAAAEADIVVHAAQSADDVPSAKAIAKGLAAGHTTEKPGAWIHLCGTGLLTWRDTQDNRFGEAPYPDERYDDIADIDKITSLPDKAIHRDVDKIVLGANETGAVKTAIVGPPCICGPGRGPVNTRSIQVYDMAKFTLKNGFAPVIGKGLTEWDYIHVHDVSDLILKLVESAQDSKITQNPEFFGAHGYYFCEAGPFKWGDVAKWVADEMVKQGFMAEPKVEVTTLEKTKSDGLWSSVTWAINSKSFANRARKNLGWEPTRGNLKDAIPEIVSSEAKRLGIKPQAA
ncbi:hypothetical protein J7T55_000531 [Diaporthe amygdali]|uniref:uncharacterized protein n=1 Tax=Phomopsis amygdali TaxID=1214568 RepID=UPI0022FE9366|nr:uncharacterized protein J7T55_000531 [Diaporthe amygdali]KAJ0104180.1 hypothetical protein J7T55_000531 [Diaporthe amygdali]